MMHHQTCSDYAAHLREFIRKTSQVSDANAFASATEQEFHKLACDLFQLQFANNAAYRRVCEARGIAPASVSQWQAIPAVPTVAFKELEMTSLGPRERTTVFYSSGTTE